MLALLLLTQSNKKILFEPQGKFLTFGHKFVISYFKLKVHLFAFCFSCCHDVSDKPDKVYELMCGGLDKHKGTIKYLFITL